MSRTWRWHDGLARRRSVGKRHKRGTWGHEHSRAWLPMLLPLLLLLLLWLRGRRLLEAVMAEHFWSQGGYGGRRMKLRLRGCNGELRHAARLALWYVSWRMHVVRRTVVSLREERRHG